ncbi:hypothetical protein HQN90_17915 [Paenibacillus alba]|uniref:hypothetical protein n=1 Tax=Paenibacillus alba TaxID=1197127 RepID=UPI00156567E7|nr:hypothetical protein [Paenibacillus alba]NQX68002.1 hypothetical protein [Paenibacillus alba]
MKKQWKTGMTAVMLGTMLIQTGVPVYAADSSSAASAISTSAANYGLTSDIRSAIKNLSVETKTSGLQISATIRLYNGGSTQNRVPEHELRVRTSDGLVYTLKPSVGNKAALQPKEIAELTYMNIVDSKEMTQIDQVSFVDVNEFTYPKVETTLLSLTPTAVWYGQGKASLHKPELLAWGQTYSIPGVNSGLQYKPVEVSMQSTSEGQTAVVTLLVENPGAGRETLPDFRLDAQSESKTYQGTSAAKGTVLLEPGEKKYLHYVIPVEIGVTLANLLVVSTETFVPTIGTPVRLDTGKLGLVWPEASQNQSAAPAYTIGQRIAIDSLSKVFDNKTEVALMELTLHDNPGDGYKTVVAKFKLTNSSDAPIAMPTFQTEVRNTSGVAYKGSRQTNVTSMMNPGLSYVVSYAYKVPQSENEDNWVVKLLDAQSAAPYTTTIAAVRTKTLAPGTGMDFALYPFDINLRGATTSYLTTPLLTYTYKIQLDMGIVQKENVVVDDNFSKLRFEIVDGLGRTVGSKDVPFTGVNKLISGKQTIDASNIASDQVSNSYTLNIYEVIETQDGLAKRFLRSFN